ncbi:MAG: hypothetical protein HS113_29740 [Verrucomicrobiales bacterium]|nr:hypothetical protein [Verrucomicrobiales bacterium]
MPASNVLSLGLLCFWLSPFLAAFSPACLHAATPPALHVACAPDNDLYRVLRDQGLTVHRADSAAAAIAAAPERAAVLLLPGQYPETPTPLTDTLFAEARRKHLRLYVEFPAHLPGLSVGPVASHKTRRARS